MSIFEYIQTSFGVIGGIIAILGYFNVIKSIEKNARERQKAIKKTAEKSVIMLKNVYSRSNYMMIALSVMMAILHAVFFIVNSKKDK